MSSEIRRYEQRARAKGTSETRRRIVDATVQLHKDVGPASTTIADISRRAGVSRVTVYQHFPDDAELYAACQRHFLELNPRPDLGPALTLSDPVRRVRVTLGLIYGGYALTEPMTAKVQRDRHAVPALDALLERTVDEHLDRTAQLLAAGFRRRGKRAERLRSLVRLAVDFWTWSRLNADGLDDGAAADLMTQVIAAQGMGKN